MEWLGILGTIFILVAFVQKGELRIRVLDLIGAILFVIYGITIASFSTIILNVALVIIQIIFIVRLKEELSNGKNCAKEGNIY